MCRVSAPTRCISAASRLCSVSRLGRRLLAALRRMLAETGRTRRCASESHGGSRRRRQSPREPYAGVRAFARAAATACLGQRGNDGRNTNPSPPKFEARRNNDRETTQEALTEVLDLVQGLNDAWDHCLDWELRAGLQVPDQSRPLALRFVASLPPKECRIRTFLMSPSAPFSAASRRRASR